MRLLHNQTKCLLLIFSLLLTLNACTAVLIKPEDIYIDNKSHIEIPINARLSIFMTPVELNKKYRAGHFVLDEGRRIQNAAIEVFSKLFHQALPSQDSQKPHLVANISGSSYINIALGSYNANATVLLYYGNGDFVARFNENASTVSVLYNDPIALGNAYIKAFEKISNQILLNKDLAQYFISGFTDELIFTPTQPSDLEYKSRSITNQETPSRYDAFLNSVVVLNTSEGIGTGFLVSSNGYLLTNHHVIGNDTSVSVKMRDGRVLLGNVESVNIEKDLALVKIFGNKLPWLVLGPLSEASIGTEVLAIGTPEGLDWSVSKGIVSAIRKLPHRTLIQTDTAINSGNSGGPLISLKSGKVLGVNTLGVRKDISEGLNFAVSAQDILKTFQQIQENN